MIGELFGSEAQTLVNTVNCVGVMGKGLALEFKKRFPVMYKDYASRCERGEVRLGEPYLFRHLTLPWVLNFPTKQHWRSVSNLDDIVRGLEYLSAHYQEWGIASLAVPPLGCGHGQLEWRVVGPTLYRYLDKIEVPVELYAPYGTSHAELNPEFLDGSGDRRACVISVPKPEWIKPEWVVVVEVLRRVEEQPYHWPISRTMFNAIAYVATREGVPTGFAFGRGKFGPYSPEVRKVEARLENNGLICVEKQGRRTAVGTGPTFATARHAYREDIARWEPVIERMVDLFMRVDSGSAEIMTRVVFATDSLTIPSQPIPTERDVLDAVLDWRDARPTAAAAAAVADSIRSLAGLGWLRVTASPDLPVPDEFSCSEVELLQPALAVPLST